MADRRDVERRTAEWLAVANRKETVQPERGYVARYEDPAIDAERARQEADAAGELARAFLSNR